MLSSAVMLLLISLFSFALFVFATDQKYQLYQTRPELRVPFFTVTKYDEDNVSPGFIFFAAYYSLRSTNVHTTLCADGAYIFDNNGDLIWSDACAFDNDGIFDFRVQSYQGKDHITFGRRYHNQHEDGQGVFLGDDYEVKKIVKRPGMFNIHEFTVKDGKTALYIYDDDKLVSTSDLGLEGEMIVKFEGFREVDVETSKILFDWSTEDHIPLDDTTIIIDEAKFKKMQEEGQVIDYVHMNSVDKFSNGDYLVSFRHTDAICRINGATGDIVWRLGGKKNDFKLKGFEFIRQHDARVKEELGDGKYKITFFDNSAGDPSTTVSQINEHSSGRVIAIDENNMVAENVLSIANPNGEHNQVTGNFQSLPNGNYFIAWNSHDASWQSEHTSDGSLVQTTIFHPVYTYRCYKYNFIGRPREVPMIRSFVYGSDQDSMLMAIYVSWNGATEVRSYNYYAAKVANNEKSSTARSDLKLIGNGIKNGFETLYMYSGYVSYVVAEALDADGNPLENGLSEIATTEVPREWHHSGFSSNESLPGPEDLWAEEKEVSGYFVDFRHPSFTLLGVLILAVILISCIVKGVAPSFLDFVARVGGLKSQRRWAVRQGM